jgi:hypothetical protein
MSDSKKEDTLWKTLTDYRANLPKADNDGFEIQKVLCKDGKFDSELSSPNVRIDTSKTCINNGGRAENQPVINAPDKVLNKYVEEDKEEKFWRNLGIKRDDFFKAKVKGRLYLALLLVGGYFAYKKFKK